MSRGGYRPGSGPKKGTKYKKRGSSTSDTMESGVAADLAKGGMPTELPEKPVLPLDYMLRVLNDPETDQDRRDKMAQLAAPYLHAKAEAKGTKKEGQLKRAGEVAEGRFGARPAPGKVVNIKGRG